MVAIVMQNYRNGNKTNRIISPGVCAKILEEKPLATLLDKNNHDKGGLK